MWNLLYTPPSLGNPTEGAGLRPAQPLCTGVEPAVHPSVSLPAGNPPKGECLGPAQPLCTGGETCSTPLRLYLQEILLKVTVWDLLNPSVRRWNLLYTPPSLPARSPTKGDGL